MAVTIEDADAYIEANVIDIEDWDFAEDAHKTRILNTAERVLNYVYSRYVVPDEAVYEFANALAVAFNDVNRYQQHGVASFSVDGISFTFKDWAEKDLADLIPWSAKQLIGDENDVDLTGRGVKWTVLG